MATNPIGEMAKAIHDSVMTKLEEGVVPGVAKAVYEAVVKKVTDLVVQEVTNQFTKVYASIDYLRKTYEGSLRDLVSLIKSMPTPQVPEGAIRVEVNQSPSYVNVPEGAIRVETHAPQVIVPVGAIRVDVRQEPSQVIISDKAFDITLNQPAMTFSPHIEVPQGKAPQVSVVVPEKAIELIIPKRTTKTERSIIYSETTGRPQTLLDVTTEE